ncbi:hypothetical protein SKAU_G00256080 [Synaphobranchus kaupii]|uniref:Poly [ADP-ribose] polymerase n=1 Tax=Synaphobranchus kaupii TaxID=118154 RepID=A0A9Q1F3T5_SYNKA|nr:hypothetical protein SKAU_G00256080 [Synaphobranchus kaupii]
MEDHFPFPLWVEGDWDPGIPKLKNKLNIYFQSKKSKGDDCLVEYKSSDGQRAIVRFKTEEVRRRVFEKQGHELKVGQGVLKLTVTLPQSEEEEHSNFPGTSEEIYGDGPSTQTQDETKEMDTAQELETVSVLLENVPETMSREMIEMLVENISDTSAESGDFSLKISPDISVAVVSFKNSKEVPRFLSKCPSNKMFKRHRLSAKALDVPKSVKVEKRPPSVSTERLQLYTEREEGEELIQLEDEQSCSADGDGPSIQTQDETKETDTAQELETVSVLLENVPETMSREMIEMLVENISDTSAESGDFSLEIIPDISVAVVSFKNSKKVPHFLSKCPSNKMFQRHRLSARALEVTKSVKVDKIPPSVSTEHLQLYFEREGEVEEVIKLEDEQSAIITFRHPQGVNKVKKKSLCIQKTPIGVYSYYKSLGTALYGRERPTLNLPDSFTESMDSAVWKFLQEKKLVDEINENMAGNFCKVDLQSPEVHISPLPSLLKQKGLKAKHINGWKENATETFHLAISKFQSFECQVTPAVWTESETEIRAALTEAVVIVPALARGVVALAGLAKDVNSLKDVLVDSVVTATSRLERERDSIVVKASVAPSLYHILQQDGLPQKMAADYPELKITYSQEDEKLILSGLSSEAYAAKSKVLEEIVAMKRKVVEVEENVLAFLCEAGKEELWDSLFMAEGIKATYETDDRRVQVIGVTDQALCDAEKQLKTALGSYSIKVEDQNVLRKPEWQDLVNRLKESFNSPVKMVTVRRTGFDTKQEVVVSGFQSSVKAVGEELLNFMSKNTIIDVTMDIKSRAILKFIEAHKRKTWPEAVEKDVQVNFKYETRRPSITLHGPRAYVVKFKNLLQSVISSVHFDTVKITKAGAKKFFKDKQDMLVGMAAAKVGCVVQLVEEEEEEDEGFEVFADSVPSQKATPQARLATEVKQLRKVQTSPGQERVQTKEGLTIILSKGNIQDASTDVIVNILGGSLSLDSGTVSNAILLTAGPGLQSLVQAAAARDKSTEGSVLVTKGCNLKSEHVFHAITPHWKNGKGNTEKVLGGIVEECLDRAEELQQGSISFPAIGSGNLGFPKDLVASMFLGQILDFSSKKNPKDLREVVIVLHPSDAQTCQAFSNEFSKRFMGGVSVNQPNPAAASTQPGKGLFSKVTPISQGHEMSVGGVLLQVVTGDITKETTDAIVNSSNADFSLRSGVSKAILDAAGPAVDAECKQLVSQGNQEMITTQPGNLKSKKIIHIVGQTDITKITGSVKAVLKTCAQNKFASVSFPALGTGQGGVNASQVADAMLDAVADVVQQDPATSLQVVKLVVFQAPMLANFHSSMQKREGTATQKTVPTIVPKKLKLFLKPSDKEDKRRAKKFSLEGNTVDPAIFHLCGDSQESVEDGKRWIEDLVQKELDSHVVKDEAVLDLTQEDIKKILELQQRLQVSVKLQEGVPEASIIIEGLSRDVLKATSNIQDMLKKARDEETQNRDAELISNLVEWQYQQGGQFLSFDRLTNLQLEQAQGRDLPDVTITIHGQPYKVSLPNKLAMDSGGNQLQIKRIDKLEEQDDKTDKTHDLPQHWSPMPASEQCLMSPLQAGTKEHTEVLGLFQATCPRQVSKIERVQNPCLWKNLQILKQSMDRSNGHQNNEKRLFHGTSQPTIQHVNHRGFNRSYAGKNAAAIGNGTYFAVSASYSASNTYSVPDAQGQKYMYLCRVLTGDFTTGRGGMIVPPPKSNSSHLLYNSVTDNPTNPSMFVIFNDIQAYPEYLITFR